MLSCPALNVKQECKTSFTINCVKICNSYRVSLVEDAPCRITFKMNQSPSLHMKDLGNKEKWAYTF